MSNNLEVIHCFLPQRHSSSSSWVPCLSFLLLTFAPQSGQSQPAHSWPAFGSQPGRMLQKTGQAPQPSEEAFHHDTLTGIPPAGPHCSVRREHTSLKPSTLIDDRPVEHQFWGSQSVTVMLRTHGGTLFLHLKSCRTSLWRQASMDRCC